MAKVVLDLSELDVAEASEHGAEIELTHPVTGQGLGQYIIVLGRDSQAFRDYVTEKTNEERRKAAVEKRKGRPSIDYTTSEESEAEAVRLLVDLTIGFRCDPVTEERTVPVEALGQPGDAGYVPATVKRETVTLKEGGAFLRYKQENLPFSAENARKFYSDPGMVKFREQVDKAIVDVANFIKD